MSYSKTRGSFLASVSLVLAALVAQQAFPATAAAKDGGLVGVEGVLINVDLMAGTVTIRNRRQQTIVVATGPATKIERNERRATLAAFQLGDRVEAKLASSTSNLAVKLEAVGP